MNADKPPDKSLAEQSQDDWDALRSVGEMFPGTPLAQSSEQLRATGGWPEDLRGSSIVLATSAGGDPGEALALTAAAHSDQPLALVLTEDAESASFTRRLLDELGRGDVAVSATGDEVKAAVATTEGPVRWIGFGRPTKLARLIDQAPEVLGRLRVTQSQVPSGDPEPVRAVLRAAAAGRLPGLDVVSADVTYGTELGLTREHSLYRSLAAPEAPAWAGTLAECVDNWIGPSRPEAVQRAALPVAAALSLPFVDFRQVRVGVDDAGRFGPDEAGVALWWGVAEEFGALMRWLARMVDPAQRARDPG